jgi:hypothetical protein
MYVRHNHLTIIIFRSQFRPQLASFLHSSQLPGLKQSISFSSWSQTTALYGEDVARPPPRICIVQHWTSFPFSRGRVRGKGTKLLQTSCCSPACLHQGETHSCSCLVFLLFMMPPFTLSRDFLTALCENDPVHTPSACVPRALSQKTGSLNIMQPRDGTFQRIKILLDFNS